jgi:hypothetical protein
MSGLTVLALFFAASVGALALRERRAALAARRSLLDRCLRVLDDPELRCGGDGFPSLAGRHEGRRVHLGLIPDTMVIRRLPQLWAALTISEALGGIPGLAVLVRPAGYEFYSLTGYFKESLDAPAGLPPEILVRGSDPRAESLLQDLAPALAAILGDPRVKEFAVTPSGLRLIWQLGEGRRGEHLLLRQAVFDNAQLEAGEFLKRIGELRMLQSVIEMRERKRAA